MEKSELPILNIYEGLHHIYDAAGFSEYAAYYTSIYLTYLQQKGWIGRRILELGCGTGESLVQFAEQRMFVTGVDISAGMLAKAEERFAGGGMSVNLEEQDIRQYVPKEKNFDLVFSIGSVLNYIQSVRELEQLFQRVNYGLNEGKTFLFDMRSIPGIVEHLGNKTEVLHQSEDIFVAAQNTIDYETFTLERLMTFVYPNEASGQLVRQHELHLVRSYPFRVITNLLQKNGFEISDVLNLDLEEYDASNDRHGRMVIIAHKVRDFNASA